MSPAKGLTLRQSGNKTAAASVFLVGVNQHVFIKPLSDRICVSVVSAMAGLLALLLIVLEWTRPGLPSPLRPICDLRVLNHFIKEARDAEVAMVRGKCMHALRSKSR